MAPPYPPSRTPILECFHVSHFTSKVPTSPDKSLDSRQQTKGTKVRVADYNHDSSLNSCCYQCAGLWEVPMLPGELKVRKTNLLILLKFYVKLTNK